MINWYRLDPLDTLFCKSAGPMVMGENHAAQSIFPPPSETFSGAFRTAVLKQNSIDIKNYVNNKAEIKPEILDFVGNADGKPGFEIAGIIFIKDSDIFVPAPYSWFSEKSDLLKSKISIERGYEKNVQIFRSEKISSYLVKTSSGNKFYSARGTKGELTTIGGYWVNLNDIYAEKEKMNVYSPDYFYTGEIRTGIALSGKSRAVRQSHLYSFTHARLKNGCSIAAGISYDKDPVLDNSGTVKVGGEQRLCRYDKIEPDIKTDSAGKGKFSSLCPLNSKIALSDNLISTGKIIYSGGWDLKKGFHKPMQSFYPAGSVFYENINSNLIKIEEN
jgi:CRISPR-associated protein Cmr3